MPLRLESGPLSGQIRSLVTATLDECIELLEDGRSDRPGSIHECRKRLKWLRALLRACRPAFSKVVFRAEDARLRDAGRKLSAWRSESAQRVAYFELARHFGLPEPEPAAESLDEQWLRNLESETAAGRRAARGLLLESRKCAPAWLSDLDTEAAADVLARGMYAEWKRARRAYRRALVRPTSERMHRWRKHVKYHMHQLRLEKVRSEALETRLGELGELGEILGWAHDLTDLRSSLAGRGGTGAKFHEPRWEALARAREAELYLTALESGAELFASRPSRVFAKIERSLRSRR